MYLISSDYNRRIQSQQLNQLTTSNAALLRYAELTAQEEVVSYLKKKYDTDAEFTDLEQYIFSAEHKALRRVYLDATAYSITSTYALNDLALQASKVYICTTAITVGEAFNASKWTLLGDQYAIFYGKLPKQQWDAQSTFAADSEVFWKDKTYKAASDNTAVEPGTASAVGVWTDAQDYTIAAETLPTNTSYFTAGDNRSQQLVTYMLDIAIYHLSPRIAPNNVPQKVLDNYDIAKDWLLRVSGKTDSVNANIPRRQPITTGTRTRQASVPRQNNFY